MSRYISIVAPGSDLTYDDMIAYVDATIASGIQVQGIGDINVVTQNGVVYVDGTDLIAEDGDIVDGGTLF